MKRRLVDIFGVPQGQPLGLYSCGHHWYQRTHGTIVRPHEAHQHHAIAMLRSRSFTQLHQPRHNLYCPRDQRSDQVKTWCCSYNCCYDGYVIGLVLVQVISYFGTESASVTASIVVRPLLVSIVFIIFIPLICVFIGKPLAKRINRLRKPLDPGICHRVMASEWTSLFAHMLVLLCVIGASYAGTSNLFAAYIAGASIS